LDNDSILLSNAHNFPNVLGKVFFWMDESSFRLGFISLKGRDRHVFSILNDEWYFLWGFETFQKQATERFLGLDFPALQLYDDDDFNVEGANEVHADNHLDDASSK
jgi:hypothetical protein